MNAFYVLRAEEKVKLLFTLTEWEKNESVPLIAGIEACGLGFLGLGWRGSRACQKAKQSGLKLVGRTSLKRLLNSLRPFTLSFHSIGFFVSRNYFIENYFVSSSSGFSISLLPLSLFTWTHKNFEEALNFTRKSCWSLFRLPLKISSKNFDSCVFLQRNSHTFLDNLFEINDEELYLKSP